MGESSCEDVTSVRLFLYGIAEAYVIQGVKQLKIEHAVEFTDNISEADALLALQCKLKKNARLQAAARSCGIPIYAAKASSSMQLSNAIMALMTDYEDGFKNFDAEAKTNASEKIDALEEARLAIEQVVIPKGEPVELLPRPSNIILLQKDLIRKYKLQSERVGPGQDVRLHILPFQTTMDGETYTDGDVDTDNEVYELCGNNGEVNVSPYCVERFPLLPDLPKNCFTIIASVKKVDLYCWVCGVSLPVYATGVVYCCFYCEFKSVNNFNTSVFVEIH